MKARIQHREGQVHAEQDRVAPEHVRYWMKRAREALEEADVMARAGHWNTCLSRQYFACYYAVSGLLARHGLSWSGMSKRMQERGLVKAGES